MEETWKTVKYAENYEISDQGNIRTKKNNRLLKINYERLKETNTRARPGLTSNGKLKQYYLHRIVAEHFLDNPNNLPEVNHKDGDFYNNKLENLEWISKIDNMRHAVLTNCIKNKYRTKIKATNNETNEIRYFESITSCSNELEIAKGAISRCCRNKLINKKYKFEYDSPQEPQISSDENVFWKEYPECTKYLVSNTGEVKHKRTDNILKGSLIHGYRNVLLHVDTNKPKLNRLIHRMVALTFLENPENKPAVDHIDTNKLNNNVKNLRYVTYKENMNNENTIIKLKQRFDR
jgi:hypothetical protein